MSPFSVLSALLSLWGVSQRAGSKCHNLVGSFLSPYLPSAFSSLLCFGNSQLSFVLALQTHSFHCRLKLPFLLQPLPGGCRNAEKGGRERGPSSPSVPCCARRWDFHQERRVWGLISARMVQALRVCRAVPAAGIFPGAPASPPLLIDRFCIQVSRRTKLESWTLHLAWSVAPTHSMGLADRLSNGLHSFPHLKAFVL